MDPTPLYKLTNGISSNSVYVKREDLIPLALGGNKARKATEFMQDIRRLHHDSIITYGSRKSNHCRTIAIIASMFNIPCYIVTPESDKSTSTNSRIIDSIAVKVIYCALNEVESTIGSLKNELIQNGKNPYFIPGGGHSRLGTLAYVKAYEEIIRQEDELGVVFDYIFLATGTGTTQAGLICGKALLNCPHGEIVGVSIARRNPYGKDVIAKCISEYLNDHVSNEKLPPINLLDDYILNGYGIYNDDIKILCKNMLIKEGLPLDLTYTGKAFWGMRDFIIERGISRKNILFIHTGGLPLFFDDIGKFL